MPNKSWFPTWSGNREADHFRGFKTQVDSLFEDWFGRTMGGVLAPRVDISEDETNLMLTAELPGVNEKDIDISLVGDQLTIKGEKQSEHKDKEDIEGHVVHRVERSYGSFHRTLTLPYEINPNDVSAQFKEGILRITMRKPADPVAHKQEHKVPINKSDHPRSVAAEAAGADPQDPGGRYT